jgi:hypothetical protein
MKHKVTLGINESKVNETCYCEHVTILVQEQRNKTQLHYQNATTHMQV